jgi:heme exporter protein B
MSGPAPTARSSGAGFFRAAWTIALKDLRVEWKTLEGLSTMALFAMLILVIFNFAFDLSTVRELGIARLVPGVLWTTLAFAGIVGFSRSFQIEARDDALTALLLSPIDRGSLFAGKTLANLITLSVLQVIVVPLSAVFFNFNLFELAGPLAVVLIVHTLGLSLLGTLLGALAARVGRGETMIAILLFAVAMPLFISAVQTSSAVLAGDSLASVSKWLSIAAAFDLLYLFVGLAFFEFVLEE